MKTKILITAIASALLLILPAGDMAASAAPAKTKKEKQQEVTTIRGRVVDAETNQPLVFASIAVQGSNVSTVTNLDGEFTLKLAGSETGNLEFSYVGYKNRVMSIDDMKTNGQRNVVELETAMIPIKEVIVKPLVPEEIMEKVISSFDENYPGLANDMTGFYRETIRKNRSYISIGEAVVEVFKAPYQNDLRYDAVRIYKGRKSNDVEKMDTVLFKLQGGPTTTLYLDVVKNPETFLTREALSQYELELSNIAMIDDRTNYVINFYQKPSISTPLYQGRLFIDIETYAVAQAEFAFNLENKDLAASMFIRKKPLGMQVTPELTSYLVRFREQDGKWYFTHSRAEVKFKVDWKKKLFNTNYTTMSELAITDRTEEDVVKFSNRERIKPSDFFTEEVAAFADPDFWGDYNVIEPDQSIEAAIRKLSRKVKFSDRTE
ncbi:MAG: carboxypeptidase-like regulatory domain-containing protein [Bacteroidales bacterium]|nr:MAG: carboxypeptidase-like regulatory domain-containing protein [Bacteroidota bacterium]